MCNCFYVINSHVCREQIKLFDKSNNYTKTKETVSLFGNINNVSGLGIYKRSKQNVHNNQKFYPYKRYLLKSNLLNSYDEWKYFCFNNTTLSFYLFSTFITFTVWCTSSTNFGFTGRITYNITNIFPNPVYVIYCYSFSSWIT